MKAPVAEIDAPYSEAGAVPTKWDETLEVLEKAEIFWICTVRADGRPHLTPLVSVWLDDALYFSTGPPEQKYVNMEKNPNILLVTGRNDWKQGLDVSVEGKAVRVTDEGLLRRLVDKWGEKWDGRWTFEVGDGGFDRGGGHVAFVYALEPRKILAFRKGNYSVTRYRF